MNILALFSWWLFPAIAQAESSQIELLMKARGLQSIERIEALIKKNGHSKGKNLSKKEECDWALENLYLPFANPETAGIVAKTLSNGDRVFNMLFRQDDRFHVQVQYRIVKTAAENTIFNVTQVDPETSLVALIPGAPEFVFVKTGNCFFTVSIKNPLGIKVEPTS